MEISKVKELMYGNPPKSFNDAERKELQGLIKEMLVQVGILKTNNKKMESLLEKFKTHQ